MTKARAASMSGLVDVARFVEWAETDPSRWERLVGAMAIHRLKGAAEVQRVTSAESATTVKVRFGHGRASQVYTRDEFVRSFLKVNLGPAQRK